MHTFTMSKLLKTVALSSFALTIAACNPILRTHGYVPSETDKPQQVVPGTDTKATVLSRLGNPSTKGVFEQDVWYYMSSVKERLAYIKPHDSERQITAIVFDDGGDVQAIAEYGVEDGRIINFVGRETPTRGREVSVLEQIFGTIGVNTETLTGDQNVPGGGGGPGG